jgi:chromosome segregation ATPase
MPLKLLFPFLIAYSINFFCKKLSYQDDGVNELAIANLERNELKNRTVELEEELAAKKTALKEISKENTELRSKLEELAQTNFGDGQASIVLGLNERISSLEKVVDEKRSSLEELQKENGFLRKRVEEFQDLDRSESSQIEELKGKLTTKQVTLDELNKQNEELSNQVQVFQAKLSEIPTDDISEIMENLKIKENSVQQLGVENEQQRSVIKSLEERINQSNTQIQNAMQSKDQEMQQVARSWKEYLSQNMTKFNEQLMQKEQQVR